MRDDAERHRLTLDATDAAGVVFAPTALAIAHRAYERAALARGLDLARVVREHALALPVVRIEADYRAPLRHGDEFAIAVACARVGDASYAMRIDFATDAAIAIAAVQTHACLDVATGRARALPQWLRALLDAWR